MPVSTISPSLSIGAVSYTHLALCRDARSERPLYQIVTRIAVLRRTHRPCVPTNRYTYCCTTTDAIRLDTIRPSLHGVIRFALTGTDARPCVPTTGCTFRFNGNGRTTVRPYKSLHVLLYYDGRHPTQSYPCVPTRGYTSLTSNL